MAFHPKYIYKIRLRSVAFLEFIFFTCFIFFMVVVFFSVFQSNLNAIPTSTDEFIVLFSYIRIYVFENGIESGAGGRVVEKILISIRNTIFISVFIFTFVLQFVLILFLRLFIFVQINREKMHIFFMTRF